ncbi:hypothetical protein SEA_ABBYPAIGE_85 [Mycobacterium phage AbbyPaige]|uniref:RDF protein n=1 Tax=Mycobacterium phage AbbyPaige TaxID=2163589 RepID=A0A2S1PAM2_9CAUD|nr:hypothetical protein SEA_ABBYPAIGE_85 [Mycobacterium phage AbbyPaige]
MVIRRVLLSLVLLALLAVASIQVGPAPAHAEVSAECWAHLAEHPGTTPGADRRYHLEHGEFSPCTEQDANEDQGAVGTRGPAASSEDQPDKKSRYCRKHWYC